MTFAPRFAPDGRRVRHVAGRGRQLRHLCPGPRPPAAAPADRHPAIDTSPSFSPDGAAIVFNSDRGGTPAALRHERRRQRRGSGSASATGRYGSPAWSPRGDLIAFTKIKGGLFHIGVMRPDGSDERLLTRSTLDESPTWAPNGRVILFSRKDYGSDRTPPVHHRCHRLQRARGADSARCLGSGLVDPDPVTGTDSIDLGDTQL